MSFSRSLLVSVLALGALTLSVACKRDDKSKAAGASSSSAGTENAPANGACIETLEFLVPFQKYGDADMVRSITVDGDQVYFRNYTEMFQCLLQEEPRDRSAR